MESEYQQSYRSHRGQASMAQHRSLADASDLAAIVAQEYANGNGLADQNGAARLRRQCRDWMPSEDAWQAFLSRLPGGLSAKQMAAGYCAVYAELMAARREDRYGHLTLIWLLKVFGQATEA